MSQNHLQTLFRPESIAVIGASTEPGTVGNDIAKNLIGGTYQGKVFLVNPKTDRLLGVPCYSDIDAIGSTPDLAIIVVPATIVPTVLRQAGKAGVHAAIVISAGFRETGKFGQDLENELAAIAKEYDIALLGPNCLGFLAPSIGLNASFAPSLPDTGHAAFLSQSGALMTAVLDLTRGKIGFSEFISTGNKAVIDEHDLIAYLRDDAETRVVSFYTEGLSDATSLIALGREFISLPKPKPLIVLKSGRTESGIKASGSHTGALAGSDTSYEALFRQARIIRAKNTREFLGAISVFSSNPVPEGLRVAIITNAGGLGVLAADAVAQAGLTPSLLSELSRDRLRAALPPAASVANPIDLLGDARSDRYRLALDLAAGDHNVDSVLVILTPQSMTEAEATAEAIIEVRDRYGKPVIAVFSGGDRVETGRSILRKSGISVFDFPEEGAEALGLLSKVSLWRNKKDVPSPVLQDIDHTRAKKIFDDVRAAGRIRLYEYETYEVLSAYGFPLLESRLVHNAEEAENAVREIGGPAVMKIVSPDIIHKTDAGGVLLDIHPKNAAESFVHLFSRVREKNPDASLEGAIVMRMAARDGKELIIGAKKEHGLGTVLVLGMGGIYTEAIRDASFRFAPITRQDSEEMFFELRSANLLSGIRGEIGIDKSALFSVMERLSRLVTDFPEIAELDINPLFVFPESERFAVADARIAIEEDIPHE
ncbi:MAG: CoA-binding protein [Candidatus Moranbacteria bacterium]|nr:CoA-binding protein [Candidatus Moranbacteria bacterium]